MKNAWVFAALVLLLPACGQSSGQTALPLDGTVPSQTQSVTSSTQNQSVTQTEQQSTSAQSSVAPTAAQNSAQMQAELPPAVPLASQSFDGEDLAGPTYSRSQYHEFQVDCPAVRHAKDDPIIFPGRFGASHDHTFFGNRTTNAATTAESLETGTTSCQFAGDKSAYWTPTLYSHGRVIDPDYVIVYYKSGIDDYPSVKPFPEGLKIIAGFAMAKSTADFPGTWSCGDTHNAKDFPATCPAGSKLIARLKAPSCWDGVHLDSANHRDHMAYPVNGACPADHPVAVPMLEFKVPYVINGTDMGLQLASGAGFTFHEDFISQWDASQNVLVSRCVNGGRQCGPDGYDPHKP